MLRSLSLYVFLFAMACVLAGCSDDPATPKGGNNTVINGILEHDTPNFSYVVDQATHPRDHVPGPFILQGHNLRYDDAIGALVVDLTITNGSPADHPEPVTITFLSLLPDGVSLLDPPNGEPTYEFGFANDDGIWTRGETSFPLTVSFVVDAGVSIAFAAEIGLGFGSASGVISGYVWSDGDLDGIWDDNEAGLGGIPLNLFDGNPDPDSLKTSIAVWTAKDGSYAFTGLNAGAYAVRVMRRPDITPTTPALMVLLTEDQDGVGTFAGANFGVVLNPVDSLVISANADAMIRSDVGARMNDNHGADPFLGVGTGRGPVGAADAIRSLVRFDVALIQAPIVSAHLQMTLAAFRDGADQTYTLGVHPIIDSGDRTPWIEGNGSEVTPLPPGVEWVDTAGGVAWIGAVDGGDANNQTQPDFKAEAAATAIVVQGDHTAGDIISWDVTALVQGWLNGEIPNLGVVIRDAETEGTFRQIWLGSRDGLLRGYTDYRVQKGPRLVLAF